MAEKLRVYGLVTFLVSVAFTLQFFFRGMTGNETLFLFFTPVIIVSAWYGGLKPGVAATVLSGVVLDFFFLPPVTSFQLTPLALLQLLLFIAEGIGISYIFEYLKQTEVIQAFKKKEREHEARILTLEEKLTNAQKEIKARDEFLSIASHELKTPLTSVLLQLQTVLHNIKNVSLANFSIENLLKMLESAEGQTNRLAKMINDLFNVSQITTRKLDLELEKVDLSAVTKEVVDDFSEKLHREGYSIIVDAKIPVIGTWDKVRIEQALTNLVSNAIKYGDKKPIEVKVFNSNATGKVMVKDHGIGIPEHQKDKIFALFERAAPSNKYKGLGVGLYITNQIVKAHQGILHVESHENKGSTFTMELPIHPKNP